MADSTGVAPDLVPEDHVIVVFGATGDLARRQILPSLFHLAVEGLLPRRYRIVGSSLDEMTEEDFRVLAKGAAGEFGRCNVDVPKWDEFAARLSYVPGEFGPSAGDRLAEAVAGAEAAIGGRARRLFYLSVPPPAFVPITRGLSAARLTDRARVVFEKPFGSDLGSFRELNRVVCEALDESQVYRIDHFLGKETVQNILALRFANGLFEPVWNRDHIAHVQIDVPETIGIGTRAGFYEKTGALRDMVVTHLFQVMSFVAMEPPSRFTPEALIQEKLKVFESMAPLRPEDVVRGQFEGYRDIDGVAPGSETETFVAVSARVENWRWSGVPFYLRTGKRLAQKKSVVTLAFHKPPLQMFRDVPADRFDRDLLNLELGPNEGITVVFLAKSPGAHIDLAPARLDFRYEGSFGSELVGAYERLLHDALIGDRTLFTSADGIERLWEIVDDVIKHPPPLHLYEQGTWGPAEAEALVVPEHWHLSAPMHARG